MMSFSDLPEECVSNILSLSTPRDACRAAAGCSALRSAAASDYVWGSFLPNEILSRVDQSLVRKASSKKELFFKLCNSLPIDGGTKIFILERSQGLKSFILSARELKIPWSNDPIYWSWRHYPFSRFPDTAELRTTSWLEIKGKVKIKWLSPNTAYGAYLLFKVSKRAYGLDTMPMELSLQVGNHPVCHTTACLHQCDAQMLTSRVIQGSVGSDPVLPCARDDGWMEIEMGRFFTDSSCDHRDHHDGTEVEMSMMEIKGHHLKGGLVVEGIEIRPI